jgi:hypothetical protein
MTICKKLKSLSYASPGTLMTVRVLVSAAKIESEMAHHGIDWSARK